MVTDDRSTSDLVDGEARRGLIVVDDHLVYAEMLAFALEQRAGMRCLGVAASAAEGVALARDTQPDVVIMDISMPREDGLSAIPRIREVAPGAVVAVVTAFTAPEWVSKAAQAGASAFIPKSGSLQEMVEVMADIQAGKLVIAPSTFAVETRPSTPQILDAAPDLSAREIAVLRLLADGTPVRDMAPQLGITVNTCRGYIKSVRHKLGAPSQLEAVLKARELGLID